MSTPVRFQILAISGGTLQAEVIAQRRAGVVGAEQAALLQAWHDLGDEGVELPGKERRQDVKAVGGARAEPSLQHVGDLSAGADQQQVAARRRHAVVELAQRELVAPRHLDQQSSAALEM